MNSALEMDLQPTWLIFWSRILQEQFVVACITQICSYFSTLRPDFGTNKKDWSTPFLSTVFLFAPRMDKYGKEKERKKLNADK
jgi:hypothetical protein